MTHAACVRLFACAGWLPFALVACLAVTGCGPRRPATAAVAGRILLDGQPLAGAAVLFEPVAGGRPARGSTRDDGGFTLTTFDRDDGVVPGRHRVAVTKVVVEGMAADAIGLEAAPAAGPLVERAVVPSRYGDPAASGLEADVPAGGATVEFTLDSK